MPKSVAKAHESLFAGNNIFKFNVSLEIKEDDGKGNFVACPKDKNFFKLRVNVDKKLVIVVTQVDHQKELEIQRFAEINIVEKTITVMVIPLIYFDTNCHMCVKLDRCFGLLLSPGRNVKNSDMHIIDMVCR